MLKCGKNLFSVHSKRILYYVQIQSHLGYGLSIWGNMSTATDLSNLQKLQNKGVALINNTPADVKTYKKLNILRIKELLKLENCKFGFKLSHHELPPCIEELSKMDQFGNSLIKSHLYNTRKRKLLNKPLARTAKYKSCIIYIGTSAFEPLQVETRMKPNLPMFTKACKKEILIKY